MHHLIFRPIPMLQSIHPTINKNNNKPHNLNAQKEMKHLCTNLYEKYRIPWENLPSKVEQGRENPRKSETNTRVGTKNVLKIPTLKLSMVRKISKMGARDYIAKQIFYGSYEVQMGCAYE
ncbi:unnamed protein product, partial [Vitis vinifera]|uniref:Uncharacterized protein n=1 Tax=Vitis vinifera TaxID=29760 RepID=D7TY55_VITVI